MSTYPTPLSASPSPVPPTAKSGGSKVFTILAIVLLVIGLVTLLIGGARLGGAMATLAKANERRDAAQAELAELESQQTTLEDEVVKVKGEIATAKGSAWCDSVTRDRHGDIPSLQNDYDALDTDSQASAEQTCPAKVEFVNAHWMYVNDSLLDASVDVCEEGPTGGVSMAGTVTYTAPTSPDPSLDLSSVDLWIDAHTQAGGNRIESQEITVTNVKPGSAGNWSLTLPTTAGVEECAITIISVWPSNL